MDAVREVAKIEFLTSQETCQKVREYKQYSDDVHDIVLVLFQFSNLPSCLRKVSKTRMALFGEWSDDSGVKLC